MKVFTPTTVVGVFIIVSCLLFGRHYFNNSISFEANVVDNTKVLSVESDLEFVPHPPQLFADCNDLFTGTKVDGFNFTSDYWDHKTEFDAAASSAMSGQPNEGFSGQLYKQYLTLHYLAQRPTVRTICETGFNSGHSSFNFLSANKNTIVYSFDLGKHQYAHAMSDFLRQRFANRLFVHFGDSSKTIPTFIRSNPDIRCDLMYVDGGHTYPVALADLTNLASIAGVNRDNFIVFDDYPAFTNMANEIGRAWEDVRRMGFVRELTRCIFKKAHLPHLTYRRGFAVGQVVRNPTT